MTGKDWNASGALWAAHAALRKLGIARVDDHGIIHGKAEQHEVCKAGECDEVLDERVKTEVPKIAEKLEAGSYDLFVELKEGAWTLILSTQPTQDKYDPKDETKIWGSYGYDPKFDVVRVPMTMVTPAVAIDQFTIAFADMTDAGGKLAMAWEKTAAFVPFTVAK